MWQSFPHLPHLPHNCLDLEYLSFELRAFERVLIVKMRRHTAEQRFTGFRINILLLEYLPGADVHLF